jgi:hypothetical protein
LWGITTAPKIATIIGKFSVLISGIIACFRIEEKSKEKCDNWYIKHNEIHTTNPIIIFSIFLYELKKIKTAEVINIINVASFNGILNNKLDRKSVV